MPAVSPTASIIHSTPYNDASGNFANYPSDYYGFEFFQVFLVRPVVATGWGAGFGVSSVSTTNPMMSAPRPSNSVKNFETESSLKFPLSL